VTDQDQDDELTPAVAAVPREVRLRIVTAVDAAVREQLEREGIAGLDLFERLELLEVSLDAAHEEFDRNLPPEAGEVPWIN